MCSREGAKHTFTASVRILAVNIATPAGDMVPLVIDQAFDAKTAAGRCDSGTNAVGARAVVTRGRRNSRVERAPVVTLGETPRFAVSDQFWVSHRFGQGVRNRTGCHTGN